MRTRLSVLFLVSAFLMAPVAEAVTHLRMNLIAPVKPESRCPAPAHTFSAGKIRVMGENSEIKVSLRGVKDVRGNLLTTDGVPNSGDEFWFSFQGWFEVCTGGPAGSLPTEGTFVVPFEVKNGEALLRAAMPGNTLGVQIYSAEIKEPGTCQAVQGIDISSGHATAILTGPAIAVPGVKLKRNICGQLL